MKLYKNWLDKVDKLDDLTASKAKINMAVAFSLVVMGPIIILFRHLVLSLTKTSIIHLAISHSFFLISLYLLWRDPKNKLSGFLNLFAFFCIAFSSAIGTYGLRSPATIYIVTAAFCAPLLVGKKSSIIFLFLLFLSTTFFYLLGEWGKFPPVSDEFIIKENTIKFFGLTVISIVSYIIGTIAEKIPRDIISELQTIYESHPNGVVKINKQGEILFANKAFHKIFPSQSDNNIKDAFTPFLTKNLSFNEVWNSNEAFHAQTEDGRFLVITFEEFASRKNQRLIFISDITMIQEKSELEKIIVEKNIKAQMVATYNHELNNPLMIALAHSKRLAHSSEVNEVNEVSVEKLTNALTRMKNVVRKIDRVNRQNNNFLH